MPTEQMLTHGVDEEVKPNDRDNLWDNSHIRSSDAPIELEAAIP